MSSPTVKKTFKLLGHKRTASSDSKTSQSPVSLLGCSKQSDSDLNNLCINGSHLFTEETKSSSTVSLNSIEQDSVEDVLKHNRYASCVGSDKIMVEQQCHLQQEEKSEGEKRCIAKAKGLLEEEEKCKLEASRLREEQENGSSEEGGKKQCISQDETQRKKWREEEEKIRKLAEERKMSALAENARLEEECHGEEEEQRQQEEISMSERLTSLFGIVRKKKEELQQDIKDEPPTQAPVSDYSLHISQYLTNPFEDIPLNSVQVGTLASQKADIGHQDRSAMVFLNRTAKESAVKPR